MANALALKRLRMELVALQKNPVEHIVSKPHDADLLSWHYVVEGPAGTPYEGGLYHGVLRFPPEYPFKPPSVIMLTKNGRFKTNTRLCLSMSDFHPESWNPMWSVSSILTGLLSFMLEETPTLGSVESTEAQRRKFALNSLKENVQSKDFRMLFPQYVELYNARVKKEQEQQEAEARAASAAAASVAAASAAAASASAASAAARTGAGAGADADADADANADASEPRAPAAAATQATVADAAAGKPNEAGGCNEPNAAGEPASHRVSVWVLLLAVTVAVVPVLMSYATHLRGASSAPASQNPTS
jgi:ubiquitin-conjugating enzyme E2 J2